MLYELYMRSEAWQRKRKQVLARSGERCERCGHVAPWLDVHHLRYANLSDEPIEDLQALCRPCHEAADAERRNAVNLRSDTAAVRQKTVRDGQKNGLRRLENGG